MAKKSRNQRAKERIFSGVGGRAIYVGGVRPLEIGLGAIGAGLAEITRYTAPTKRMRAVGKKEVKSWRKGMPYADWEHY